MAAELNDFNVVGKLCSLFTYFVSNRNSLLSDFRAERRDVFLSCHSASVVRSAEHMKL